MIQQTEYRLGNLIEVWDGNRSGIYKVDQVNPSVSRGSIGVHVIEGNWGFMINFDLTTPIQITPELLEKCGFKHAFTSYHEEFSLFNYTDHRDYDIQYCLGSHNGSYPYTLSITHKGIDRGIDVKCQYLHQLQNLFFALTGQELTINLNAATA